MPVNKHEFVESLAVQCDISKAEAGRTLEAILDSLTQAMADGEEVRFTGFGTFSTQRRRAREGVNPQDPSRKIRIRAAHVPKFKPGASLRTAASEAPASEAATSEAATNTRRDGDERSESVLRVRHHGADREVGCRWVAGPSRR
jgi:DNA-binding protein HU-beta